MSWKKWLVGVALGTLVGAGVASAGVLSVKIPTQSGVEVQFGMIQEFAVHYAQEYDFMKDYRVDKKDKDWETFVGDPEGPVRGDQWTHMVYFPIDFVKKDQWKVHLLFSYKQSKDYLVDQAGGDNDRWRVERAYFEFKLPIAVCDLNTYIGVGHEVWGLDAETGGLVYYDDDPGIRWFGNYKKFSWDFKWVRKTQRTTNVSLGYDSNRDIYLLRLAYDLAPEFKPRLYLAWDRDAGNNANDTTFFGSYTYGYDIFYGGLGAVGTIGPVMYQLEGVYQGGSVHYGESGIEPRSVKSWAALANFQVDVARWAPSLNKFVVGLGGLYAKGDDDPFDKDIKGFTGSVTATRFFSPWNMSTLPIHGENQMPTLGTTVYSWLPVELGVGPRIGGVSGSNNAYGINPGLIAGVFTIDWDVTKKLNAKFMVKYLRWDETAPIAAYYAAKVYGTFVGKDKIQATYYNNKVIKIDEEIGWETDLLLNYKLYDEVTLFAGGSVLFPGNGIDDINAIRFGKRDSDSAYHIKAGVKFLF
ncbi:MAG: hypothetical protein ACPLSJ_02405 [Thermosulfidibacteraceae bacterium]